MKPESRQTQVVDNLRSSMRLMEQKHAGAPVQQNDLQAIIDNVHGLYSATFRLPIIVPVNIIYPLAEEIAENDVMKLIPRAVFARQTQPVLSPDGKRVKDIRFGRQEIRIFYGQPGLIDPQNTLGVFRAMIAHEYTHGQTRPLSLLGDSSSLKARDIGYGGELHTVTGFKVGVADLKSDGEIKPLTATLDEYVVQYLAMCLYDSFNSKDTALEGFMRYGIGISQEYIAGANYLKEIFDSLGIKSSQVEDFHFRSDLRGFIQLLNRKFPDLGKKLLKVGMDRDLKSSIEKLRQVKELILSRK